MPTTQSVRFYVQRPGLEGEPSLGPSTRGGGGYPTIHVTTLVTTTNSPPSMIHRRPLFNVSHQPFFPEHPCQVAVNTLTRNIPHESPKKLCFCFKGEIFRADQQCWAQSGGPCRPPQSSEGTHVGAHFRFRATFWGTSRAPSSGASAFAGPAGAKCHTQYDCTVCIHDALTMHALSQRG